MGKANTAQTGKGSFVSAGLWSIIGTVLVKGTYFLTIPLFSRMLTTAEYGEVSIFMTYASVFTILLSLQLVAAVSPGSVKFQKQKQEFLSSVLWLSVIVFLVFVVFFQVLHTYFEKILGLDWLGLNCLLLYSFSMHVISFNTASLIMDYHYKKNALICFLALFWDTVLSVILIITAYSADKFTGRIVGATIPNVSVAVIIAAFIFVKGKRFFNGEYWKYALNISVPLIFHMLGHIVLGQSDRLMIKSMVGVSEAGIYALIYNLAVMLNAVQQALNNVWIPWFFRKLKEEAYGAIKEVASTYVLIFSMGTITLMAFSTEVIKIIAPPEYWGGISCTVPLVLSTFVGFVYTLYVNVEIYYEQSKAIAAGTCGAAIINIVLNYLLLPKFGYAVAAYTTLFSYLLLLILHYIICTFVLKKRIFDTPAILKYTGLVVGMGVFDLILADSFLGRMGVFVVVMAVLILFNKRKIVALFTEVSI